MQEYRGRYSASEISIGVADEAVLPFLEQTLRRARLHPHYAGGTPLTRSQPFLLLRGVAQLLEHSNFSSWSTLLRHPDVERMLRDRIGAAEWLGVLSASDDLQRERLPAQLDLANPSPGNPTSTKASREAPSGNNAPLVVAWQALEECLAPLRGSSAPFQRWCVGVSKFLQNIYESRDFDLQDSGDERTVNALRLILEGLERLREVPNELLPSVSAAAALRFMLEHGAGLRLPAAVTDDDIELLGWLELLLDDAPVAVVTGFNEGSMRGGSPQSFLPDSVR